MGFHVSILFCYHGYFHFFILLIFSFFSYPKFSNMKTKSIKFLSISIPFPSLPPAKRAYNKYRIAHLVFHICSSLLHSFKNKTETSSLADVASYLMGPGLLELEFLICPRPSSPRAHGARFSILAGEQGGCVARYSATGRRSGVLHAWIQRRPRLPSSWSVPHRRLSRIRC